MKMRYAAAVLLCVASPTMAADFTCTNHAAEISCNDGKCEIAPPGGFTPMSLSREGGMLEICAYSGCASGPVTIRRTRGKIDMLYAVVRWRNADGSVGVSSQLAVILDRKSRTAMMHWDSFSNVMDCTL